MSVRKYQLLRYAHQKNAHLRNVNSAISDFASLELDIFLSNMELEFNHINYFLYWNHAIGLYKYLKYNCYG